MLTPKLIDDALESLLKHLADALKISLIPFGIALLLSAVLTWDILTRPAQLAAAPEPDIMSVVLRSFLAAALFALAGFHVAVRWHRFSMGRSGAPIGATLIYMVKSVAIMLALGILLMLALFILAPILAGIGLFGNQSFIIRIGALPNLAGLPVAHVATLIAINAIATFVFAAAFMRWSPWMVASALGDESTHAIARTASMTGQILHVAAIYTLATFLWSLFGLIPLPGMLSMILNFVFLWLAFMMSIAVLTEIYRNADAPPPTGPIRIGVP